MMKGRLKYWVTGTLVAFSGVAVVKVMAPLYSGNAKIASMLAGYTLSILGLFIIMLGTRRTD
jgi:uncharacterized membrane protein YccC